MKQKKTIFTAIDEKGSTAKVQTMPQKGEGKKTKKQKNRRKEQNEAMGIPSSSDHNSKMTIIMLHNSETSRLNLQLS